MESAISATNQHHRERQSSRFATLFILTFIFIMMVREHHTHGHYGTTVMFGLFSLLTVFSLFNWWVILKIYPVHDEGDGHTIARAAALNRLWQKDRKLVNKLFRWTNVWLAALAISLCYGSAYRSEPWIFWIMLPYSIAVAIKWAIVDIGRRDIRHHWHKGELERLVHEVAQEHHVVLTHKEKYEIVDAALAGPEYREPNFGREILQDDFDTHRISDWFYHATRDIRKWFHQKYDIKTEVELRFVLMTRMPRHPHA